MPPIRLQTLRGTIAQFMTDIFSGRCGAVTDAPIGERWGWRDGGAWHYAAYADAAGNVDSESLATSGAVRVDFEGNGSFRALACAEKLQTNGAADPGWGAGWKVNILGPLYAIATEPDGDVNTAYNAYHDGDVWRCIEDTLGPADVPLLEIIATNGYRYRFSDLSELASGAQITWSLRATIAPNGDVAYPKATLTDLVVTESVEVAGSVLKKRSFASIYRVGAGTTQSIPTGSTFTKITPFDVNLAGNQDSTPDQANSRIVIGRDGVYEVHFSRSYQVGTDSVLWHVAILKNGTAVPNSVQEVASASTATSYCASVSCHIVCASGDVIEVGVYHDKASSVSLNYQHATLNVEAID